MKKYLKIHTKKLFFNYFALCIFVLKANILLAQSAATPQLAVFNPKQKLSQYVLDHWTTANGLLSNNIRCLFKTQDGYLWLGGFDGLCRFDGVRFNTFNKKNTDEFNTNMIFRLTESPDSTIWLATHGSGLLSFKQGQFKRRGFDDMLLTAIWQENDNRIWLSGRDAGVFTFSPKTQIAQKLDYQLFKDISIYNIQQDKQGAIWFCTDKKGIVKSYQNQFTVFNEKQGLPVESIFNLFFDSKGKTWVCTNVGLYVQNNGVFSLVEELGKNIVYKIVEDGYGSLWIATSVGLFRKNGLTQRFEKYPSEKEAPLTNVLDLLLDEEGSLWIATYRDGLYRLKESKFVNYTFQEGLASTAIGSVCQLVDGSYLIGANNGKINQIKGEEISVFPVKQKLPDIRVFNIKQDKALNIWISTYEGLLKISPNQQETFYTKAQGLPENVIRLTFEDKAGNIWGGTRTNGLFKIDKTGKIRTFNKKNGLSSNFIMSIQEDKLGNILVGTNDGGLNIIEPNNNIKVINNKQGLANNLVFNTYIDAENIMWIATNVGLSRYDGKKIVNYAQENTKIPQENCFDIVEDDLGFFWIPNATGIIKVKKAELNLYAQKPKTKINWKVYNKHDGMKSEDCTGAAHSLKAKDGTIWIPTNGGIVKVNPLNLAINPIKPKVVINQVLINDKIYLPHQPIKLIHEKMRFVFDYSALSYLAHQNVKFKYKLEGYDERWLDAGTERTAIYTNIPPNRYVFRVIASNNDGLWNEVGASLRLEIKPPFTQTYWFYALVALSTLLVFYFIIQYRTYRINARNKELEMLVVQRTEQLIKQNTEIEYQKQLLTQKNEDVLNSINYAKRIQEATLPNLEKIKELLPQSFIFYKPLDIVSGDFYWFQEIKKENLVFEDDKNRVRAAANFDFSSASEMSYSQKNAKFIITAIDSTGHGVPGAFMSLIGNDLLNEIVNIRNIYEPNKILNFLHKGIQRTLKQEETDNRDGMDMGVCVIEKDAQNKSFQMDFAGAKNPVVLIQNYSEPAKLEAFCQENLQDVSFKKIIVNQNQLFVEIRGDKYSIGGSNNTASYTKYSLKITTDTWLYLFTDGLQDQFGEKTHKKFSRQQLRETFINIHQLPATEQEKTLEKILRNWQGKENQIDDILVIGFKLEI